ncbi:MAG TPA: hypothetical protein VFV38_00100, partial [Ktedonobacteraceae bacterium]|nr:hypothetical protein [Ktedonobacteraceae bacterium]
REEATTRTQYSKRKPPNKVDNTFQDERVPPDSPDLCHPNISVLFLTGPTAAERNLTPGPAGDYMPFIS